MLQRYTSILQEGGWRKQNELTASFDVTGVTFDQEAETCNRAIIEKVKFPFLLLGVWGGGGGSSKSH